LEKSITHSSRSAGAIRAEVRLTGAWSRPPSEAIWTSGSRQTGAGRR
jgi:hypothetical protein